MAKHRMTPKRRAALRKAQLVSARKRRRGMSGRKKAILGAAGTAAVLGTAITARHVYNKQFTNYYHATHERHAASIKKHGLQAPPHDKWGMVFFTNRNPLTQTSTAPSVAAGHEVFGIRLRKSHAKRIFKRDPFQGLGMDAEEMVKGEKWVMVHQRHLKGIKIKHMGRPKGSSTKPGHRMFV